MSVPGRTACAAPRRRRGRGASVAARAAGAALALMPAPVLLPGASAHGELGDRIARVTRRIAEDPGDAVLYLRRGGLHALHRDWAAAEADYRRAAELAPGPGAADLALGTMFLEADRPGEALHALDRFLVVQPAHAGGLAARARALRRLGRPLDAAADYTSAIEAQPAGPKPPPELYLERADALAAAGDDWIDEALCGLDEGLARLGHPVSLELRAIELEVGAGRFDEALRRIDRAGAGSERRETWLARRAEVLERAGRGAEARREYELALLALDRLEPQRRGTRAMAQLGERVRAGLERVREATHETR